VVARGAVDCAIAIVIGMSVCLSLEYLENHTAALHQNFVYVVYIAVARSSILWQRCDKLRTSGFVDDVRFHIMALNSASCVFLEATKHVKHNSQ